MIKIATVCSGIGSPEQALKNLNEPHDIAFACEIDKYARQTYEANFKPKMMLDDMTKHTWAYEKDSPYYADLFVGGIPCQAFSLAGKRLGENDPKGRGILFYDFYRYVKNQRPKAFIIENVKGLLSDNNGVTFQNWCALLGGSINGHHQMFHHEDCLHYNLHWTVLNTKDFGLPQNRERVFIVGIRPDLQSGFKFPKGEKLKKRLKDVLEPNVDEKYYLSDTMIAGLLKHQENSEEKGRGFKFEPHDPETERPAKCLRANLFKMGPDDNYIAEPVLLSDSGLSRQREVREICPPLRSHDGAGHDNYVVESNEIELNQVATLYPDNNDAGRIYDLNGLSTTLKANGGGGGAKTGLYVDAKEYETFIEKVNNADGLTPFGDSQDQKLSPTNGLSQTISAGHFNQPKILIKEATQKGFAEAKDGDSINYKYPNSETRRGRVGDQVAQTLENDCNQAAVIAGEDKKLRIRRLTPLECFRLQGFPDEFVKPCSDTQTYKQAGNTISTSVLMAIFKNLLPIIR